MAAYAALVSLMNIIEQIQHHPRPPISLYKKQVESLTKKVTFLQDFLENYPPERNHETDALEILIADAAQLAEDIIESHIVNRILTQSTTSHGENITSFDFYQRLWDAIEYMDLIMQEVTEKEVKVRLPKHSTLSDASSRPPTSNCGNTMVGSEDVLMDIMDNLTGQQSNRQIIPIAGMGGIGKTTLAQNVYIHPLIVHHFDICAWVTISQNYNVREILLEILVCSNKKERRETLSTISEEELGEKVYKALFGRRYLIVMDDMWSIEVWYKLKFFFPENNNGSRIMITTRLSKLAYDLTVSRGIEINLLDEGESWNLLRQKVFGEECCPPRLEGIGKKIATSCKGLPLSISVIGGLLAKSQRTLQYWEYIAKNLNTIVNLEDDSRCLEILSMSYFNLPVYLKPCFLYMGVFSENQEIRVSSLIKLWVAEGFLKPISGKCLEEKERRTEMAAYAALVSVMHTEIITFLQDFLEVYPHDGSQEAYDLPVGSGMQLMPQRM
ncbi:hypothetical protein BUALT_BualtUnG0018100 [Buddleja alternifolia]|uniref:NB-ARC domain-containing protein n=1 Tax=Buddleja alternifolia TaxID=168488 RepID=A0AAV6W0K6_9LAMI|nr:hypothetical protein BUALT_BualtUnG0018100 [Buddleja alternifolia]